MSAYPTHFDNGPSMEDRPGWFKRNWLWFIPTIILLPMCCCCGGPLGLIWWGVGQVLDIPPYKDSITLAEQDPEVQNQLGTPIDGPEGFMGLVTTLQQGGELDFSQVGSQMQFNAKIPLSGPNGTGTLIVQAESLDGVNWTYTVRQVELADGTIIDLIPPGQGGPAPTDDAQEEGPEEPESPEAPDARTPDA
jgi:hypothetical protein